MSGKIGEIGEKKDDDKWAQVKEQREKFAAQNNSKAAEGAGAGAAAEASQAGAAGGVQGTQAVNSKSDVAGISPEALAETKKTDTGNATQEARVNFGAWGVNGGEAKAGEAGNDPSKAEGVSNGQSVGKSKDTGTNNNPKRAAGEAGASEAASNQAGASTANVQGAGGIQVNEASGAATANKPQTVPGVGESQASKKGLT